MRTLIGRWRRLARPTGGRLQSLVQDSERGHLDYVEHLDPGSRQWLRTKPFHAPPVEELGRCLHSFAHIVDRLRLGYRAQVLDVGCGPGWLTEYLVRCGYWVAGIDLSPDMLAIARARIAAIPEPIGGRFDPFAELALGDVREMQWSNRFDAAILYDTMHHFDHELETLKAVRRSLVPGGRIYLHEGVRPEPGSRSETHLIEEMRRFGTLESPFDPDYLVYVAENAGFSDIERFVEIDCLFELADPDGALEFVKGRLAVPDTNTLIAVNRVRGSGRPEFSARVRSANSPSESDGALVIPLELTNTGRCYWPHAPLLDGAVTIGPFLFDGERVEFPRTPLPQPVAPGETMRVEARVSRAQLEGRRELRIDLVREGVAWFYELGSEPLVLPLPAD